MLALGDEAMAAAIRPAGLYNMKTRNIRKFCTALIEEHGGVVPRTREGLLSLPGIGRKCADIVQSFAFDMDVIAVDTHVHRVCNRLGLARGQDREPRRPRVWRNARRNGPCATAISGSSSLARRCARRARPSAKRAS